MSTLTKQIETPEDLAADMEVILGDLGACTQASLFMPAAMYLRTVVAPDEMGCVTACTDAKYIYIHLPYWNMCTRPQKCGLILHECLHPLLQHLWRFPFDLTIHQLVNYACDVIVNNIVKAVARTSPYVELPPNPPQGELVVTDKYGDLCEEEVYNKLFEECEKQPPGGGGGGGDGDEDENDGTATGKSGKYDKFMSPGEFIAPNEDAEGDDDDDEGDMEQKWKDMKNEIIQVSKLRGDVNGDLVEMLEKQTASQTDWRRFFRAWCATHGANEVSETMYDRRFIGEGDYIEALEAPGVDCAVFVCDSSGSMLSQWCGQSKTEIESVRSQISIEHTYVLDNDTTLEGGVRHYLPGQEIEFVAHGRGGTDFRPPFKWCEDECPHKPRLMVFFTDGDGPFPEQAPSFPVLWVTFRQHPSAYPFGDVIDMRQHVS